MNNPNDCLTRRGLLGRALGTAALVSAVEIEAPLAAQTAGTPARIRDAFDFDWKFFKGDAPGAQQPEFADAAGAPSTCPTIGASRAPSLRTRPAAAQAATRPPGSAGTASASAFPRRTQDRKVVIEFDGVYQNSEVWINGQYLGKRPFGYVSFAYDLTPHLNAGRRQRDRRQGGQLPPARLALVLRLGHLPPHLAGGDPIRSTWRYWGTFVTTPRVCKEAATVQVKTRVRNEREPPAACTLASAVVDRDGKAVQTAEAIQEIGANGEYEFVQQMAVDKPSLWSLADPYLYKLRSTVRVGQQVVDEYETPFGIREAVFDADEGFLLNGERVKLNGVCLHHDGRRGRAPPCRSASGSAASKSCERWAATPSAPATIPRAPEFLDLCDRMGFCVMNEAFDEWKAGKGQISATDTRCSTTNGTSATSTDFVRRDRNHPSVVLWSCGNEIGDQLTPRGVELLRELLEHLPPRGPDAPGDGRLRPDRGRARQPRPVGVPEPAGRGGLQLRRPLARAPRDVLQPRQGGASELAHDRHRKLRHGRHARRLSRPGCRRRAAVALSPGPARIARIGRGFRGLDTEQLWRFVSTHDYVAGDFMWTGIDYLGESCWPNQALSAGCIDSCGFPKDGFYFYQSQWTEKPMLHLFPHWNWKGREGQFITVTLLHQLRQRGTVPERKVRSGPKGYAFPRYGMQGRYGQYGPRSMDGIRTTNDLHLAWDVPYEPGTLQARWEPRTGRRWSPWKSSTTGEPAAIGLSVDRADDPRRPPRRGARHGEGARRAGPHASGRRQSESPSRFRGLAS